MSDVISFRLDKDNPREEKARQVIKSWYVEGYSLRYIMTEALLRLDEPQQASSERSTLGDVNDKLNRINQLLEWIGNGQSFGNERHEEKLTQSEFTAGFLRMIRQAAKPGLRCNT